jgi:hypothetical protein
VYQAIWGVQLDPSNFRRKSPTPASSSSPPASAASTAPAAPPPSTAGDPPASSTAHAPRWRRHPIPPLPQSRQTRISPSIPAV